MSAEIRFATIAAAIASLLSALTGLLSRVTFGALMVRAILSGLAFAALAGGAIWIARKFLPELYSDGSAASPSASEVEPEHRLNIVLPGEGEDSPSDVEAIPEAMDPGSVGEEELRDLDREAEEIGTDSLVPAEEASAVGETPRVSARPPASFEELDVLPDLDGLSDVFSTASHESIDAGTPAARDPISTSGASRDGVDAVVMAQAVRTLLKRDQKG